MSRVQTKISEIDLATGGGIAASDLTVIATSDDRTGHMVLGHYLMSGLKAGETTLLISFERHTSFFDNFENTDLKFKPYYDNKKFLFFNFMSNIRHKVGFLQDYRNLFEEIYRLAGNEKPTRIAIQQTDALLNLNNIQLIHLTAEKLASACRSRAAQNCTTLAQFVKFADNTHDSLAIALQKSAAGYIELLNDNKENQDLNLSVKKMPWFHYDSSTKKILQNRAQELFGFDPNLKLNVAA